MSTTYTDLLGGVVDTDLEARVDALEEALGRQGDAVALLLSESRHANSPADYAALRREVRREAPSLLADAGRRARERLQERTPVAQFTGLNTDAIREFCGDRASVVEDGGGLTLIQHGAATQLRRGDWISLDPDTDRISLCNSPLDTQETT